MKTPRFRLPIFVLRPTDLFAQGRLRYWTAAMGRFGAVQFMAQALMASCGLLIVRSLSKQEYALFLLANTLQGTMNVLADAGASIGLMVIGGKVWQDRYRLGQLVNSTLDVRRKMLFASVLCGGPLLLGLLYRNGATPSYAILITLVTLASLHFMIGSNVSRLVLQLHSKLGSLQRVDLSVAVVRLGLTAAVSLVFLNAALAITVMTFVWVFQWRQLSTRAAEEADTTAPANPEDVKFIREKVRQLMPNAIFYCLQGQIYIFILSVFGRSDHLAEVGALGRLAIFFGIATSVMHGVVFPAFTRCHDLATLRQRYVQILCGFAVLGAGLIVLAMAFPYPMLWILGGRYANLQHELVLCIAVAVVSGLADAMWSLNCAKGWTQYSWVGIPLQLSLQAALLFCLNVQTVRGVLYFSLISMLPAMIVSGVLAWRGLFSVGAMQ